LLPPFEGLLGNNCELKLVEFLMPLKDMEFNLTELAKEVNVSRPTVDRIVKKFVKWGLMKVAHTYGKTKYYALNEDSDFVGVFEDLNNRLVEQILGQEKLAQVSEYWTRESLVSPSITKPSLEEIASWAQTDSVNNRIY
jgi:predicted transcriptional regulator